jgi:hypothetical protein
MTQNNMYLNSEEVADVQLCDLYLASCLVSAGVKMLKTSIVNNRVYFHFDRENEMLTRIKQDYLARNLQIDALTLVDNIKSFKSLCAELLNNRRGR